MRLTALTRLIPIFTPAIKQESMLQISVDRALLTKRVAALAISVFVLIGATARLTSSIWLSIASISIISAIWIQRADRKASEKAAEQLSIRVRHTYTQDFIATPHPSKAAVILQNPMLIKDLLQSAKKQGCEPAIADLLMEHWPSPDSDHFADFVGGFHTASLSLDFSTFLNRGTSNLRKTFVKTKLSHLPKTILDQEFYAIFVDCLLRYLDVR